METGTSLTSTDSKATTIKPRFVFLNDAPVQDVGLFTEALQDEEQNERAEKIEKDSALARDTIKRLRDQYEWLGMIGQPKNEDKVATPTLSVYSYSQYIPQHPWSYEDDDHSEGTEIAISNPLPGVVTVFIESRGRIIATKVLQQGEILYGTDSSNTMHSDELRISLDTIQGLNRAGIIRMVAEDGTEFRASVPALETVDSNFSEVTAFIPLEKQATQK